MKSFPRNRPTTVQEALDWLGYWYPPDAIAAVQEGRDTYYAMDPKIIWPLNEHTRKVIQRAIAMVKP